jgi:Fur family ferric uptake transcriptional regulator
MHTSTLRMTKQRLLILDELMKVSNHPTAYEVYGMVKRTMPQISLGTVYRNLEFLSNCGRIQRLSFGSGKRRYDGNTDNHHHLCCMACGRVDDLPSVIQMEDALNRMLDEIGGYQVKGLSIEAYGICPACREMQDQEGKNKTIRRELWGNSRARRQRRI